MKTANISKRFNSAAFAKKYHYAGNDLGAVYAPNSTTFRVWAPTAIDVDLMLYQTGHKKEHARIVEMKSDVKGTWIVTVAGDLHGQYYTYRLVHDKKTEPVEAVDPYAVSTGANGMRAAILNMRKTDPKKWEMDSKPAFNHPSDAIIYEAHVRDMTIHATSGAEKKGKYLGLTERGLKTKDGIKVGLDHIVEMGVSHLHLLPVSDYASVDETKKTGQYNWGYDPMNYNVPEGSYATDPYDASVRVLEFKKMVQGIHKTGLRVVLDVVYNHTYFAIDSNLNHIVPNYYYRQDSEGGFSNGSACGNETASDRSMVRKFMVDSIVHWVKEYHVDGFRFDLMGLHDLDTMKAIRKALDEIDPSIITYGEGWTGGDSPCPRHKLAMKTNVSKLDRVAAFNDTIRDAIKGHVAKPQEGGFVQGFKGHEEKLKTGITAAVHHKQIKYSKQKWEGAWATEPYQCVSYDSCHDNHTLWDKIVLTTPKLKESDRVKMNKLAGAIVMTSQGIAFIHAGEEFARTKRGEENSYNLSDRINAIDWRRKKKYSDVCDYYQGLIALRKKHPAFRMRSANHIQRNLAFLPMPVKNGMVGYCIHGEDAGDSAEWLVVIFNATDEAHKVDLPDVGWKVHADDKQAGIKIIRRIKGSTCDVAARSALILAKT